MSQATADPGNPVSDEAIRTAPESFLTPTAASESSTVVPTAKADTVAAQTPVPPLPIEAAQSSARVMRQWAEPRLADAQRFASRYDPGVEVKTSHDSQGQTTTKVALSLGADPLQDISDSVKRKVGFHSDSRAAFGSKGRWYMFAATSNDAVGYNMLQGMHGEVRRAGFSAERVAALGDRQAGLAWRKGPVQASFAYVERELSTFGASVQQRFVALTISFKGWGRPVETSQPTRVSRYAPYSPDWPPQERDPRLRR